MERRMLLPFAAVLLVVFLLRTSCRAANQRSAAESAGRTEILFLGTSGGPPLHEDRSEPATLLIVDGRAYLIDCGIGTIRRLIKTGIPSETIKTIFFTHLHPDHALGLADVMANDVQHGEASQADGGINMYGPPPTKEFVEAAFRYVSIPYSIFDAERFGPPDRTNLFHVHEFQRDGLVFQDDRIRVTAAENSHYVLMPAKFRMQMKSYSYRIETPHGVVVFTGDTGPSEAVIRLAKGADVLITEGSGRTHEGLIGAVNRMAEQNHWTPERTKQFLAHMTEEHLDLEHVVELASKAQVKSVLLYHYHPLDPSAYVAAVKKSFHGPVFASADLDRYCLTRPAGSDADKPVLSACGSAISQSTASGEAGRATVLADASTCDSLSQLKLPSTKITLAELVPPGKFPLSRKSVSGPPAGPPYAMVRNALDHLPTICRVVASISPTPDSDIHIEVWMPLSGWNGKFEGVGNGGWAGELPSSYLGMFAAVRDGYATAATDTGHLGNAGDASFAAGHPERVVDFGYRAVHEMTLKAKAVVAAFYGKPAARAYWHGCSTGGKQGLTEAQRYPLDYDGIVAGAPANYWTHLMAGDVWSAQATHSTPASYIPRSKFALIHKVVLDACDAQDGVKDGVINDPLRCHFDPGVLLCKYGEQDDCLTEPQVDAARKIYSGATNPRTGEQVYPGLEPGSEMQWGVMAGSPEPPIVASFFEYLVFRNPKWDFRTLNFGQDIALSDKLYGHILNATDPDLSKFIAHGGKLLLYHGWSDGLIAPQNTVNYYDSVLARLGRDKIENSVRLFMIPGMQHCGGGDGPHQFDEMAVLDRWVKSGKTPDRIVTEHRNGPSMDETRPLCPYPQTAKYTGKGRTDDAANFVCSSAAAK